MGAYSTTQSALYNPAAAHKLPRTNNIMMQGVLQLIHLSIVAPINFIILLPYHLTCLWLGVVCNATLKILVRLGKPPKWYILAIHSRDLFLSLENVQHREGEYRQQLEQLKHEVERHDKDKRTAIRKVRAQGGFVAHPLCAAATYSALLYQVKKLMAEVTELQAQLADTTPPSAPTFRPPSSHAPQLDGSVPGESSPKPVLLLLASLAALGVAMWHFFNNDPVGVVKKVCA